MRSSMELQRGLPYRRRLFVARHRKRSPLLRLLKPFLGALLLVGSPAALTAWVLTSPEFTLRELTVEGTERVPEVFVHRQLAPLRGYPLFEIRNRVVEDRLVLHPWVRSAQVRKRLPDALEIEVSERRPVAVLRSESGLVFVDVDGVAFASYDPTIGADDLLLISGSSEPDELRSAMTVAAGLERTAPEWGRSLSEIEILNLSDFRLYCAALPFPVVVSLERLEAGVRGLRDYFHEIEPHLESVGAIDLRFERYIVVQPVRER